jgi:membrane protease subunit (stomatin/prohibitin family)
MLSSPASSQVNSENVLHPTHTRVGRHPSWKRPATRRTTCCIVSTATLAPISQGTSLTVRENEIAALVVDNYITNVLAPGIYRLDREHLGELEAIFSWPVDYAGAIGADVYFVSVTSAKRHLWQSRPGEENQPR